MRRLLPAISVFLFMSGTAQAYTYTPQPTLSVAGNTLKWTAVPGASSYLLWSWVAMRPPITETTVTGTSTTPPSVPGQRIAFEVRALEPSTFWSNIVLISYPQAQWTPPKTLTWYWQLQGTVNNSEPVGAYDIDGFENSASEVSTLHAKGIKAICYIDVGTWEEWRSDASSFPASVKGKNNGWPGEKYLDIRALSTLEPIMTKRFEMCRSKGFDAVEPDNMDSFENSTGFPLTGAEQITYDTWIAGEVHSLGMAVLQKNDGEQTSALKAYFDGALTEECNVYSECSKFTPYLAEGKPVVNAEYGSSNAFCSADNAAGIEGARFDLELDGKVFQPCW